jgi:PAS domain-containing protein
MLESAHSPLFAQVDIGKVAEAAGGATFESAAVILAFGVVMSGMLLGVLKILKVVRSQGEAVSEAVHHESTQVQQHTETQVVKANGVPVAFLENMRIPAWYKDSLGIMRYINPAYTITFGVMPQNYIGRRDEDVWPAGVAASFRAHDAEVLAKAIEVQFTEDIPERAGDTGAPSHPWFVVKFPVIDPVSKQVKGIAGYCIPKAMAERAVTSDGSLWVFTRDDIMSAKSIGPSPLAEPVSKG